MRRSVCVLAFTLFTSGCTTLHHPNARFDSSERLQGASGTKVIEKELSAARERNARLETQVSESSRKIETLTQGIRDLKKEIRILETTVERLRREKIIAKSFPAPRHPQKPMSTRTTPPNIQNVKPKNIERTSITPQALYNKSYRAVRDRKNEAAIRGFRRFLRLFPKNPLAPHSQYWLGEAYYALRQYNEALDEFLKLITRYPKSRKVPDAYYKRGLIYIRRNFPLNATLEFENLVKKFPAHSLSKKAKVQLQNLEHYTRNNPDDKK